MKATSDGEVACDQSKFSNGSTVKKPGFINKGINGFSFRRAEDDDDEYEEAEGGSRLFEFMFGNMDNSGDLDVDYLDECIIDLMEPWTDD